MGGAGTQTAALGIGGNSNPGSPPYDIKLGITEAYNGTSWTEVNDLNTARRAMYQFGTPTAAVGAGGDYSPASPTPLWPALGWSSKLRCLKVLQGACGFESRRKTTPNQWSYNPSLKE